MPTIQRVELKKNGDDYILIVHLDPSLTEFSRELGEINEEADELNQRIKDVIQRRFSHVKIKYVKVMAGALLVSSLFIGDPGTVAAQSLPTDNSAKTEIHTEQPYDVYTVQPGDSLSVIAKNANVSVDSIQRLNRLNTDLIVVGQNLQMPFTTHRVQAGESLFLLAQKYHTTIDAIKSLNQLDSPTLSIGQSLRIPLNINEQPKTETENNTTIANKESSTYTVVAGDSLSVIAKRLHVTVEQLKDWNHLTSDRIVVGQRLQIHPTDKTNTTEEKANEQVTPVDPVNETITANYTVVAGDSLSVIAKRFDTTVQEIKKLNNLQNNTIFVGQTLSLPQQAPAKPVVEQEKEPEQPVAPVNTPSSYIVVAGDSLSVIAKKYQTTVDAIKQANQLTSNQIYIGQKLVLPNAEETTVTESEETPVETIEEATSTYTVIAGDSLSVIAKQHQTTVDAIKQANQLTSDRIFVGQTLLVPAQQDESVPSVETEVISPSQPTVNSLPAVHQSNQESYTINGKADPGTSVTLTIRDTENNTITQQTKTDESGNFTTLVPLVDLADGTLTIEVVSTHNSGGISGAATASVQKDTILEEPTLSIADRITTENFTSFNITGSAKAGATIYLSMTDSAGLEKTQQTTADENGNYELAVDTRDFADTRLTFQVAQEDAVGNRSAAVTDYVEKDTTAPEAPILHEEAMVTAENQEHYIVTGEGEKNSTVIITIDDGDISEEFTATIGENGFFSIPVKLSSFKDGNIHITAIIQDAFENKSEQSDGMLFKNTEIPEIISIDSFEAISSMNEMNYEVAGVATPNSTINIRLSDGTTTMNQVVTTDNDGNFSIPINVSSLADGEMELSLQAVSAYGNKGNIDTHTVLKDTTAPEAIDFQMNAYVNQHNANAFPISGVTEEGRIHVLLEISDGEKTVTTDTFSENGHFLVEVDLSSLKDGPLTMNVTQIDETGNRNTQKAPLIEKDTEISNPIVSRSGYAFAGDAIVYNLVGIAEPFSTITIQILGENAILDELTYTTNQSGVFHLDIPLDSFINEAFHIVVTQSDHAGNWSEAIRPENSTHTVQSGENLSLIAKRYNTTVEAIQRVNRLEGDIIYPNQQLQLPVTASTTVNLGYMYFGDVKTFTNQVLRTERSFNVVSPSYFDLHQDGSLKLTHLVDRNFVANMHQQGMRVVPFLSNHWDREVGRAMLANYEATAQQIADAVIRYDLDGVNVDIENITHEDREQFTAFVQLLRELLPSTKEVSVAVAANPNGWTQGWHGAYDYFELSQHADYLMMMTYDESFQGSDPGPVASLPWVERSIQYALEQGVTPDKVVFGLAHYGRYWMEGQEVGGNGLSNTQVKEMLSKYDHTITYDEASQSAKAVITIREGDPNMYVTGKPLKPGTYTVWFENEQSYQAKLGLVDQYGIRGVGHWSIGQEDSSIWNAYPTWYGTKDQALEVDGKAPADTETNQNTEVTPEIENEPEYNHYTVVAGDSLYRIAQRNNITIDQIREANEITGDLIYVGQVLKLPLP